MTERKIRQTLRRLARQKVAAIFQLGNAWLIERAVGDRESDDVAAAIRACVLRGWIAVEGEAVPTASVGPGYELPVTIDRVEPVYRLTEAGWAVVHRSHGWVLATFPVATVTLIVTLVALVLNLWLRR